LQGDELSTQEQTWSHCSSGSKAKVVVFQIFLVYLVLFCYSTSNLYLCNSGWLVKHDTTSCDPPLQINNGSAPCLFAFLDISNHIQLSKWIKWENGGALQTMWILSDLITIFGDRNLLLHEAGYLKVADFGLGKLLDASSAQTDMYSMTGETGSCKWNPFFQICLWVRICSYGMLYLSVVILLQVPWSVRVFLLLNTNVGSGYLLQE